MKTFSNDFNTRLDFEPSNTGGYGRNVKLSYCEFMQKNKPQSNSIAGGLLVLGAGGYHIAWLLWNLKKPYYGTTTLFLQFSCWYFGSIIGSILGAVVATKWQKKNIYYLCGTISTIGGVIFIVWFDIDLLIAVGRLISGLAHGIAYITTITHGAENVIKEMRGRLISSAHFLIYSSVFTLTLVALYSYPFPGGIRIEQMVGILAISFSIMGLLFTPCLTYESVTYLLYQNNDRQAVENMMKLRNESVVTWNISNDLQEMKLMVTEDRVRNENVTKDGNLRPLLLMMATSLVVGLSNNLILNANLISITSSSFMGNYPVPIDESTPSNVAIAAVILATSRCFAGFVMILFGDSFSRKKLFRLSACLSVVCLLIIYVLTAFQLEYKNGINWIPGAFAVAFQIFVGAGVEPMQHVLISEAFSTAKKYWSIACVDIAGSLFQIAIIAFSFINGGMYVMIIIYCAILIIPLTVILYWKLPETRGISLRQARDAFTKTGFPQGITYS